MGRSRSNSLADVAAPAPSRSTAVAARRAGRLTARRRTGETKMSFKNDLDLDRGSPLAAPAVEGERGRAARPIAVAFDHGDQRGPQRARSSSRVARACGRAPEAARRC